MHAERAPRRSALAAAGTRADHRPPRRVTAGATAHAASIADRRDTRHAAHPSSRRATVAATYT
jgi:hypothetical protein